MDDMEEHTINDDLRARGSLVTTRMTCRLVERHCLVEVLLLLLRSMLMAVMMQVLLELQVLVLLLLASSRCLP
jgi:hypothetical protein